jgi:hypothetical protein
MRINKAKITKYNQIAIVYQDGLGNGDEYSLTCRDKARPEFYEAMTALAEHVIEMCELPDDYLERITVRGVSFSYGGENNTMGAVISASMELKESYQPLNLTTPHKASAMYNPGTPDDEKQLLTGDCIDALEALQKECEAYIKGEREQGSLFCEAEVIDNQPTIQQ